MRNIKPRPVDPATLLSACVGGVPDAAAAARLNAASHLILTAAAYYDAAATASTLHTVPRVTSLGSASAKDMVALYTAQMVAPGSPGRATYDLIKGASPNEKCPLCGVGVVRTLDHHLPKSKYPDLSICPHNLVPACDFCQTGKVSKHPSNAGEQTLHPYYDDFSAEQWIFGSISKVGNPVIQFHVAAPGHWPPIDQQRVRRHFDVIKLGFVYSTNANDDLSSTRQYIVDLGARGGAAAVQAHLEDERTRYQSRLNSWQHVMYQTLAADAWFVNGGYSQIPT